MDDFLHNLRSGKLKQSDRNRRDYSDYKGPQRRAGSDRRRPDYYAKVTQENFALVKDSLDLMIDQQKRIADALDAIVGMLGGQAGSLEGCINPPQEAQQVPVQDEASESGENAEAPAAQWGAAGSKLTDEERPRLTGLIGGLREEGQSWEKIARHLIETGVPTVSGKGLWRGPAVKKFWESHS